MKTKKTVQEETQLILHQFFIHIFSSSLHTFITLCTINRTLQIITPPAPQRKPQEKHRKSTTIFLFKSTTRKINLKTSKHVLKITKFVLEGFLLAKIFRQYANSSSPKTNKSETLRYPVERAIQQEKRDD